MLAYGDKTAPGDAPDAAKPLPRSHGDEEDSREEAGGGGGGGGGGGFASDASSDASDCSEELAASPALLDSPAHPLAHLLLGEGPEDERPGSALISTPPSSPETPKEEGAGGGGAWGGAQTPSGKVRTGGGARGAPANPEAGASPDGRRRVHRCHFNGCRKYSSRDGRAEKYPVSWTICSSWKMLHIGITSITTRTRPRYPVRCTRGSRETGARYFWSLYNEELLSRTAEEEREEENGGGPVRSSGSSPADRAAPRTVSVNTHQQQ
ncbi:hypothetical protein CRUP_020587 [Coryphaenoides rupestris]|nr:hypothetical protein CRUP_020587 [Coryphaenoides rupestris]